MRTRFVSLAAAAWLVASAHAATLSPAEITKLCGEAEGPAHCGRLVETEQLKRLPSLAVREGNTLKLSLFPSGSVQFSDVDSPSGGTSYALWDYISEVNAAVLWTTRDDDIGFLVVQRATGRQTPLPAEPILAPDRQRFATADFCPTRCENVLAVWRVTRDGIRRELEWKAPERWSDAAVRWKDADTLVVEFTRDDTGESRTLERKLADPGWSRR
jgi:hypothetical protein